MAMYRVDVEYKVRGWKFVEADSKEEAIEEAKNSIDDLVLYDEEVVEDSIVVDENTVKRERE